MAGKLGFEVSVETSNAKSQVDALSGAVKNLNENVRDANNNGGGAPRLSNSENMPRLTGGGGAVRRFGDAGPMERLDSQTAPPWNSTATGQGLYSSINSYNGQMTPGGIFRDGRRQQNINVDEVQYQLDDLSNTIKQVTDDMKAVREKKDLHGEFELSGTLNRLYDTQKYLQGQLRGEEQEERAAYDKTVLGSIQKYFMGQGLSQAAGYAIESGQLARSARSARASGDYLGADVMETKGMGEMAGSIAGTLTGLASLALNAAAPGLGTIASTAATPLLSKAGGFIGGAEGAELEEELKYSGRYKEALPDMEAFYQMYGENINLKSGEKNARAALDWHNQASDMSYGTGKTPEELMEAARVRGAYGNINGEEALRLGRQDIMWERFTGADLANIQKFGGTALRYGGDGGALQSAYSGLQASGMGKGQFDEFLTSMQRVMEDGIENGFVRGADEIAGNMSMLYKLSGNSPLWQGEQGANRLMKMNQAVAGATDLDSVEDTVVFSAARDIFRTSGIDRLEGEAQQKKFNEIREVERGGFYTGGNVTDIMQLVESGISAPMLENIRDNIRGMEHGNIDAQVERYMKIFNLRPCRKII